MQMQLPVRTIAAAPTNVCLSFILIVLRFDAVLTENEVLTVLVCKRPLLRHFFAHLGQPGGALRKDDF